MSSLPFILSLPLEISINILSRLSIPTILSCKCVCKKWLELISSLEFAERHHLRLTSSSNDKPEPSLGLAFYNAHSDENPCRIFEFQVDLPNHDVRYEKVTEFDPKSFISNPNSVICLVGSSNGLLCLQDSGAQLDSYYVCNPLTNEWISIPTFKETVKYPDVVTYGFGVSSSSGHYKVVRINHKAFYGPVGESNPIECFVYTLGTGSWRSIEGSGEYQSYIVGVFLNGYLHWLACDERRSQFVSRFDLERDVLERISTPFPDGYSRSLGVLDGCLCYCDDGDDEIVVWIMRDYGREESWTKRMVIDKWGTFDFLTHEVAMPLKIFHDGDDVLVMVESWGLFLYSSLRKTSPQIEMFEGGEAIPHASSFLSLRRFAAGEDVCYGGYAQQRGGGEVGNLIWGNFGPRKRRRRRIN